MVAIIGAIAISVSCDRLKGCRLTAVEALVLVQVPGNFLGPTTYTLQTPECLTDRNRTGGRAAHADAAALDRDPHKCFVAATRGT